MYFNEALDYAKKIFKHLDKSIKEEPAQGQALLQIIYPQADSGSAPGVKAVAAPKIFPTERQAWISRQVRINN